MTSPTQGELEAGCKYLAANDAGLGRAFETLGVPEWCTGRSDYAALARMIAFQQISTYAAKSIWSRVEAYLPDLQAHHVLACDPEDLRACGLSRPQVAHLISIATAINNGSLDLARVNSADIDTARQELLAVKGIGPWTADLFLLYGGALDAFPAGDVALMEAYRQLTDSDHRLAPRAFTAKAETWRPYRGIAAPLLWGWINAGRAADKQG